MVSLSGFYFVQVYAPYNAAYKLWQNESWKTAFGSSRYAAKTKPSARAMRHLNFMELWQEISQSKLILKQATIDSILINPIRR